MNRPASWLICTAAILALGCATASAAILYVFPNGSGAYPTIQAAINASGQGDVIQLANGTFSGPGNRDLRSPQDYESYLIRSTSGDPSACVIDLQHSPLATWSDAGLEFQGIGMRNGTGVSLANVTLVFRHCRLEGWSGSMTGMWDFFGIRFEDSEITGCPDFIISAPHLELYRCAITDNPGLQFGPWNFVASGCRFTGNAARPGGDLIEAFPWMSMVTDVSLNNCRFEGNQAPYLVDVAQGNLAATGCVFVDNAAAVCHVMPGLNASTAAVFESCTLAGQSPVASGQLIYPEVWDPYGFFTVTVRLNHTIVAFNAAPPTLCDPVGDPDAQFTAGCTDIFGNTGGDWVGCLAQWGGVENNLSLDPLFCGWESGWVELRGDSPCAPAAPCGLIGALPVGCTLSDVADDGAGGLREGLRLTASPSPAWETVRLRLSRPRAGESRIAVADASGRVVRRLSGATGEFVWDTRGDDGRPVAAGIYFARLETDRAVGARVIVLR
jgi:hypothetical protein